MKSEPHSPKPSKTWTIRYAAKVLNEDLDRVKHAAFDMAKKAIDKKLKVDPEKYGAHLHDPLHRFRKLKVSNIRIVYRVDAPAFDVLILMIGDRREIWEANHSRLSGALPVDPDGAGPFFVWRCPSLQVDEEAQACASSSTRCRDAREPGFRFAALGRARPQLLAVLDIPAGVADRATMSSLIFVIAVPVNGPVSLAVPISLPS